MPMPMEQLAGEVTIDIASQILDLFGPHKDKALTLQEIANGIFDQNLPYKSDFDIETVRQWMPLNQYFIYGNLRRVYYIQSVIASAISSLVASGKLKSATIKNPDTHKVEWYSPLQTYYYVPKL